MTRIFGSTLVTFAALLFVSGVAHAQLGGGGRGGGGGQQSAPTKSSPTQNRSVGPRAGPQGPDEDSEPQTTVTQRGEPVPQQPSDPLAISPEMQMRIGTDYMGGPPAPVGETTRRYFPYYEEQKGDYRFRMLPPLWLEHTRGVPSAKPVSGEPTQKDRESLYGLFYYQRRSPLFDADILFPAFWRVRDHESHTLVLGPLVHREAPGEHDNWLAPLWFEGERKDGGYFHSPLLLTTTHWNEKTAFSLIGLYFRDRTGGDVDTGLVPFYFHGDNGNTDGARRAYTLIPPLLYFHKEAELDESKLTLIGPVLTRSNPKRQITDVLPLFYHIKGTPETGGAREEHTTLFPFFHYGYKEDESLFVIPGYLRRTTPKVDTMITPLFTHSTTRMGSTSFTAVGPIVPLYWHYRDKDLNLTSWAALPFYYQWDSPTGHDFLTPLFGKFETYGVSKTIWAFPTFTFSTDHHGWETDLHPLIYVGRNDHGDERNSHTVLAPIFWDFASTKGRATVGFPLYWRFADSTDGSVTQVAANTVYTQKRVSGGTDWQFHLVPLFSYGEDPHGYFWNILFGLAGYQREASYSRIRAFWIPITVSGSATSPPPAAMPEPAKAAGAN